MIVPGSLILLLKALPQGSLISCAASSSASTDRSCTYTSPVNLHGEVTLRYKINDGIHDSNIGTITITVEDLTPTRPFVSPVNFVSEVSTSLAILTLKPNTCDDVLKIFIQEGSTPPTEASVGWQDCDVLTNLTYDASVSNTQGFRTLRVYGIDQNNNISTPQLVNFLYDTQAPIITINEIPSLPKGISYPLRWTVTEASVSPTSQFKIEYSLNNGASWTTQMMNVGRSGPLNNEVFTYNWNVPNGIYLQSLVRISLTDNNAMTGTDTSNVFRILEDLHAPNALSMTINGSSTPPPTPQKYVYISLEALDDDTNITHFCFKNSASVPSANDGCWRAVDAPQPGLHPSPSLTLTNYPYLLSFVPGTFNVYAWTKDLAGNISTNYGDIGKDRVQIQYFGDTSPVLTNFIVSNTSSPSTPIADNEMLFYADDTVYIKWHAVDDKNILDTIKLYYTTDDIQFTLIKGGLKNGSNESCSVPAGATGCYRWELPEVIDSNYFRVQLVVEDDANQTTSILSLPLNSNRFKILAGNMDPGIDSHAKSAVFNTPSANMQLYSLAVTTDGKVFIRDSLNGLLYINPQTGILEQILTTTGESTGDNGPVRSATATSLLKITMDYQDRLLIWDHDRIRRVDTKQEPMMIETIIGGYNNGPSGTETTDIVTNPADLKIAPNPYPSALFHALPNGDIYFQANGAVSKAVTNTIRIYRGSLANPTINTIRVSGGGTLAELEHWTGRGMNTVDDDVMSYMLEYNTNTSEIQKMGVQLYSTTSGCSYIRTANVDLGTYQISSGPHPVTFVSICGDNNIKTGMDGKFYQAYNNSPYVLHALGRYNSATNSYQHLFGTGTTSGQGFCPDGSTANSCRAFLTDFFITQDGKAFLLDNGLVRVIDDSGKIQTLYGQRKNYGDNGLAQDARFNLITYIDHGVGDNVIVYDQTEAIMREIRPNESYSQVRHLAGNGQSGGFNFGVLATNQTINGAGWHQTGSFVTNPNDGSVYFACMTANICKLNRSTGYWEIFGGMSGGHSSNWYQTGTYNFATMNLGGQYASTLLAYGDGKLVTGHYIYNSAARRAQYSFLRETHESNKNSYFLAGKPEVDGVTGCPNGAGNNCNLNTNRSNGQAITYNANTGRWIFEHHGNTIKILRRSGTNGDIQTYDHLPDGVQSMLWRGTDTLYYCNDLGQLKKINYTTDTEQVLPFPGNGINCTGRRILWKNASGEKPNRLVFPFVQNGLMGVAEYWNP